MKIYVFGTNKESTVVKPKDALFIGNEEDLDLALEKFQNCIDAIKYFNCYYKIKTIKCYIFNLFHLYLPPIPKFSGVLSKTSEIVALPSKSGCVDT